MMMQGREPVEEAVFEWLVVGLEHARDFAGGQGAASAPTGRKGYKPAVGQSPSTPCQKEPRTTSRLSRMLQARRAFANL